MLFLKEALELPSHARPGAQNSREARKPETTSAKVTRIAGFPVILLTFLVLALYYNVSTPIFEAPDELQHCAFVAWLADMGTLPQINAQNPGLMAQEGAQAPLYYWLAATLLGRLPHDQADKLAVPNPHANIGEPLRPDNKNRVLHDMAQEGWPYQGTALFVHVVRALSTLMAVGTVCAIYCIGRIAFPDRAGLAYGAMGLAAFTPQFLFLSSSVSNDNLVILIASWVLVVLALWLKMQQRPGLVQLGVLGALLGLGVLAKMSGLLLWPLAAGVLVWLAWRSRGFRWLLWAFPVVFSIALALCGWWFLRNLRLYGDLTGTSVLLQTLGGRRDALPSNLAGILAEFRGFRYSLWALFGWFNILAPEGFYLIVDAMVTLGLVGCCIFLFRSLRRQPRATCEILGLLLIWLGLMAAGVLRWAVLISSQGRLLYPALSTIALVLVVGWAQLLPSRSRWPLGILGLAAWAVCAGLCAAFVIRPAYALPKRVRALDELSPVPSGLQVRYEGCCELVGFVPPDEPAHPGDWVGLTLVWRALEPVDQNYSLFVHARTTDGQLVGQLDTLHGSGMYPTGLWHPGEIIADKIFVPVLRRADTPGLIRFQVGLYERATMETLSASSSDGALLETVFAGEAALVPFHWPKPRTDPMIDTVFEQRIRLSAVEQSEAVLHAGEAVTLTVQWEALGRIDEDYTGFIHLVSPLGQDVAQDDHPPLGGRFPTRLWDRGSVVYDPYRIDLPKDLKKGAYEFWAGLYDGSGRRLVAVSRITGERWKDDLVHIGTLVVADAE
jgi:4-amino-4-deoxy-L-arabinose transferase-like glycosyltransferase